jgi:integrase
MSILTRKKTTQEYKEKLASLPTNTRENIQAAINGFTRFVNQKYQSTPDKICEELITIKKTEGDEEYEKKLYDFLQDWIDWSILDKLGAYTIKTRFSILRSYLYYLGVKTNPQDIKQLLYFPRKVTEEKYPIKKQEIRDLVNAQGRHPKRQAFYLACSSSGMRVGEALHIKKSDLDFSLDRIMIRLKPEYTKTKTGRTTFVSKECEEKVMMYYDKLDDNDYVFTNSKGDFKGRGRVEQTALANALETLGYTERYSSNGFYKITSHSFRAFFFTAATRKHDENYAHKMTGHGGYLMVYDRMTDEEKLELYIQLEPELVVFDQTKNEIEINQLKDKVDDTSIIRDELRRMREEMEKMKESQAKSDKKTIELMKKKGIITS